VKPDPATTDDYREQIIHCARALAVAKNDAVEKSLAAGVRPMTVKMFTDGNLEKRLQKLQDQMKRLVEGFDAAEFDERLVRYIKTVPLAAYDTGYSDGERFLQWILETANPSAVQRDLIACELGRYAVETIARGRRMGHVHFQELRSVSQPLSPDADDGSSLQVHLNPIHAWGRFETNELLDAEDDVPATVIFFPVGTEVRTAVLEPNAMEIIRALETSGPMRLDELRQSLPSVDADELASMCNDLAEIGLAAIV
jgi:hypothetical protein